MTQRILKLGKYRHYRSKNIYQVIGTALHSETYEEMVVYQALYDCEKFGKDRAWVRPMGMFLEDVEVEGGRVARFELVDALE